MSAPSAVTKILLPGKRNTLLHRPRLTNFLLEHIDRKLLLVSASAGYGKTSLLIDFAYETTLPVCWYDLDPSDADPHTFLEYLIFSLQRRFPDFGRRTLATLANSPLVRDLEAVVGTLVTEIYEDIPEYIVLILDDYQTVEESEPVNHILDTLLRLMPDNAHLILSGRTMPSRITITRLAARQEIAGLGASDLRFSTSEIKELVEQTYHLSLSDTQAQELAEHSEGWITGILLTTHSLWQGLFHDLLRVEHSQVNVFDYLASEVFNQQPEEVRHFLRDSSVLNHMNASLCDSVLEINNSGELLGLLEQRNLFVTRLEEDIAWYRYHHLFREYLHSQFRTADPERWRRLHCRAAACLLANGSADQAIPHYVCAGAFTDAADVIQLVVKDYFDSGRWTTLSNWLDSLPSEILEIHPELIVWKARVLGETGKHEGARAQFERATGILKEKKDSSGLGGLLVKQSVFQRYQGKYDQAINACEQALEMLDSDDVSVIAEAHRSIGISACMAGDYTRGVCELELALLKCEEANDLTNVARAHHDLGVALRTSGSRDAESHFLKALEFWRRTKNAGGLANSLNSMGVTYYREGKYEPALETLEEALTCSRESGQMRIEAITLASIGDVYRDKGDYNRAEQAYRSAFAIAQQINESFVITYVLVALGTVFRHRGDLSSADQVVRDALTQASIHRSDYELGLAKTEHGVLLFKQGNSNLAIEELGHASQLLEKMGAKSDCARAQLHLAYIFYDKRKFRNTAEHLAIAAKLGRQAAEQQFLIGEGQEIVPLLKFAVTKKIGDGYFENVLEMFEHLKGAQSERAAVPVEAAPVRIRVSGFGIGTVEVGNRIIAKSDWRSVTAKELFFFLLSNPEGLRKEQILTTLWDDISPAKANGIFHSTAWRMRRALTPDCIQYENGIYKLNPELGIIYDVTEFRQLLAKAKAEGVPAIRIELYQRAISLYLGEFFEESYSEWANSIRSELLDRYLGALEALGQLHETQEDKDLAVEEYERLLAKDCYREDIYRRLIALYIALGNRSLAIGALQRCRESMREANLTLSEETEQIARAL